MFPCSHQRTQNTSKTKVLLQKLILACTPLLWFEIKLSLRVSIQLHFKRFATSMMSFYMTSPALFIQMPPDGLWSVKQTNSSDDYVILHEKVSSVRLHWPLWSVRSLRAHLPYLFPITCACSGPGWDSKFPHPLSSSCDSSHSQASHKLCIPGRNDLKFHVGIS